MTSKQIEHDYYLARVLIDTSLADGTVTPKWHRQTVKDLHAWRIAACFQPDTAEPLPFDAAFANVIPFAAHRK